MKKVEAIIRPEKLEVLRNELINAGLTGLTVYQVNGCGNQKGFTMFIKGNAVKTTTVYKVSISTVVPDEKVENVINLITEVCRTDKIGDGKIFVSPVEDAIRIRTGERGDKAL